LWELARFKFFIEVEKMQFRTIAVNKPTIKGNIVKNGKSETVKASRVELKK